MGDNAEESRLPPIDWAGLEQYETGVAGAHTDPEAAHAADSTLAPLVRHGDPRIEELPLTPAMIAALRSITRRKISIITIVAVLMAVVVFPLMVGTSLRRGEQFSLSMAIASTGVVAVIALGIALPLSRKSLMDEAAGTYVRTTGISHIETGQQNQAPNLVVDGVGEFRTPNGPTWHADLRSAAWRSVDMSGRAHLVFEIRDAQGAVIWRDGAYRPDSDPAA